MAFASFARLSLFFLAAVIVANCATTTPLPPKPSDTPKPPAPSASVCPPERPTEPNGMVLAVPHIRQRTAFTKPYESNLCWAASLAMVSAYLGKPRETCQIATFIAREGLDCCDLVLTSPAEDIASCNDGAYVGPMLDTLGLHYRTDGPMSEELLRHEITNGRPVIVQTTRETEEKGKKVRVAHARVIIGFYAWGTYQVNDPGRDQPYELRYAELLHGEKEIPWTWTASWYHMSYVKETCVSR